VVERLDQRRVGAHQLVGLGQVPVAVLARLLPHRAAAEALHRRVVQPDQLHRHHALDRVARGDAGQGAAHRDPGHVDRLGVVLGVVAQRPRGLAVEALGRGQALAGQGPLDRGRAADLVHGRVGRHRVA
jgi:hypothetical protein